jgi:hypothetical protein
VRGGLRILGDPVLDTLHLDTRPHRFGQRDVDPHILKREPALKITAAEKLAGKEGLAATPDRIDHHVCGGYVWKDDDLLFAVGEFWYLRRAGRRLWEDPASVDFEDLAVSPSRESFQDLGRLHALAKLERALRNIVPQRFHLSELLDMQSSRLVAFPVRRPPH